MKEVLDGKRANSQERAVLLRRMLADAGLDTRLAFATRHWSAQVDPGFPTLARFNEMLVYLPAGAWIAPRCDYCGLNELPTELRGLDVLLFNATRLGIAGVTIKSEWKSTGEADPALGHLVRYALAAKLDAAGGLTDTMTETLKGPGAAEEVLRQVSLTDSDARRDERTKIGWSWSLAKLLDVTPAACSAQSGTCQKGKRLAIPAYATVESNTRWLVPLDALSTDYGSRLTKEKDQRVAELHLIREENFEEVFGLEANPGFALETTPPPVSVKTALVETSVKVEPTPKGAQVTQTLKRSIGGIPLAQYDDVQSAYRAFQDARHLVLSFVKR